MNQIINLVTWLVVIAAILDTYRDCKKFYKQYGYFIREAWKNYPFRITGILLWILRALLVMIVYALNQK